jgi:hypothetical protein
MEAQGLPEKRALRANDNYLAKEKERLFGMTQTPPLFKADSVMLALSAQ